MCASASAEVDRDVVDAIPVDDDEVRVAEAGIVTRCVGRVPQLEAQAQRS